MLKKLNLLQLLKYILRVGVGWWGVKFGLVHFTLSPSVVAVQCIILGCESPVEG